MRRFVYLLIIATIISCLMACGSVSSLNKPTKLTESIIITENFWESSRANHTIAIPDSFICYEAEYNDTTGNFSGFKIRSFPKTESSGMTTPIIACTGMQAPMIINIRSVVETVWGENFPQKDTIFRVRNLPILTHQFIEYHKLKNTLFLVRNTPQGKKVTKRFWGWNFQFHFNENTSHTPFSEVVKNYPSEIFLSNILGWNIDNLEKILHYIEPYYDVIIADRIIIDGDSISSIESVSIAPWLARHPPEDLDIDEDFEIDSDRLFSPSSDPNQKSQQIEFKGLNVKLRSYDRIER